MESMSLANCSLSYVGHLGACGAFVKLHTLVLASNRLTTLGGQMLHQLRNLTVLDLRNNCLRDFNATIFDLQRCAALRTLNLLNAVDGGATSSPEDYAPAVRTRVSARSLQARHGRSSATASCRCAIASRRWPTATPSPTQSRSAPMRCMLRVF